MWSMGLLVCYIMVKLLILIPFFIYDKWTVFHKQWTTCSWPNCQWTFEFHIKLHLYICCGLFRWKIKQCLPLTTTAYPHHFLSLALAVSRLSSLCPWPLSWWPWPPVTWWGWWPSFVVLRSLRLSTFLWSLKSSWNIDKSLQNYHRKYENKTIWKCVELLRLIENTNWGLKYTQQTNPKSS